MTGIDISRRGLMASAFQMSLAAWATMPDAARADATEPDATEIAARIRNGHMTAAEATEQAIARAELIQPQLNIMASDTYDLARARAGTALAGPFAGVPTLIKDLEHVRGAVTRMGSRATAGQGPAREQDVYIDAVFASGVICIGKSATSERGYLPTTEPLAFGATRNPWNPSRSSGGSSGGAAAAVAAGVVAIAHATDGGGSIRFPAANCGLVGLKPSRGRLIHHRPGIRFEEIAVQGCISRTVRDTAGMLAATEARGATAVYPPVGLVSTPLGRKLKIGVVTRGFTGFDATREVHAAVMTQADRLANDGHAVSRTEWPTAATFSDDFLAFWSLGALNSVQDVEATIGKPADLDAVEPFTLTMAENAQRLRPDEIRSVQGRFLTAASAYDAWIDGFDIVLSPVLASPPAKLGFFRGDVPFETLRARLLQQVGYTLIHNISGAPAISLPLAWSSDGLPIGLQVSAANGREGLLLEFAYACEAAQPWVGRRPRVRVP